MSDDGVDGEDHSGVSDDGMDGEVRAERGKGAEEGKTVNVGEREGEEGRGGEGRDERRILSSFLSKGTVFGIPCIPCDGFVCPLVICAFFTFVIPSAYNASPF